MTSSQKKEHLKERLGKVNRFSELLSQDKPIYQIDIDSLKQTIIELYDELNHLKPDSLSTPSVSLHTQKPVEDTSLHKNTFSKKETLNTQEETLEESVSYIKKKDLSDAPQSFSKDETPKETLKSSSSIHDNFKNGFRKNISINDRILFINELFAKDNNAFIKSIEKIESMSNKKDVLDYIQNEVATVYQWDKKEGIASIFYQLIDASVKD